MKGGDGIFSNIFMKSRGSKLFKKTTTIPNTSRVTATTTASSGQTGRAQSTGGSESTLSSVHSGSMTGYAGNLSPPVLIPLHVLMYEDADADNLSLVTQSLASARVRSGNGNNNNNNNNDNNNNRKNNNNGLITKPTKTNERRMKQAKKCDGAAGCSIKKPQQRQQRRPTTTREKTKDNRSRKSAHKRSSSSMHSTALPSTIAQESQHENGTTSINITRRDSSDGSAVECLFTDAFVIDTFRSGGSTCSSDSS